MRAMHITRTDPERSADTFRQIRSGRYVQSRQIRRTRGQGQLDASVHTAEVCNRELARRLHGRERGDAGDAHHSEPTRSVRQIRSGRYVQSRQSAPCGLLRLRLCRRAFVRFSQHSAHVNSSCVRGGAAQVEILLGHHGLPPIIRRARLPLPHRASTPGARGVPCHATTCKGLGWPSCGPTSP